jgi:hypothetical protein
MTTELTTEQRAEVYGFDPADEIGFVGTRRAGGMLVEEFLPELAGTRGIQVFREMGANDPIVGSMLTALKLLARQVTWSATPADQSPRAREIADWFETVMDDMNTTWDVALSGMMSFLQYGWFVGEIVPKRRLGMDPGMAEDGRPLPSSRFRDGLWGLQTIEPRLQDTLVDWTYDGDAPVAMHQQNPLTGETAKVPLVKCVHLTTTAERANPEGVSVLRAAYLPWYMKRRLQELEAIGVERDLVGMPMAEVPVSVLSSRASDNDKATLSKVRETVTKVRRNETDGLVFPMAYDDNGRPMYKFSLLTSGGARQFDIGAIVTRYDQRILLAGLTDFLLLGHEGVSGLGVTSIGSTKVDLVNAALETYVNLIAAEINAKVSPLLMRLNGWPTELAPTWVPGRVDAVDLDQLGKYITALAQAGMPLFPNPELEQHLSQMADLPYDPDAAAAAWEMSAGSMTATAPAGNDPEAALAAAAAASPGETMADKVLALGGLIRAGFDPIEARDAVGLPPIAHTGLRPVTVKEPSVRS